MSKVKSSSVEKFVKFIQYDIPPMKAGEYTITVDQEVNQTNEPYSTSKIVAVAGERFMLDPTDFNSIFPQNLANGEFLGVLPLVVFNRRTLPWERTSVMSEQSAPWLAVFLFNEDEVPQKQNVTAKDLVKSGEKITVWGSDKTGIGALPDNYYSYPGFEKLDYGESPDDPCTIIDIPADTFNKVCPSATDLPWLAHIRETETVDKENSKVLDDAKFSVISCNRLPQANKKSYVYLVSLENMGDQLPSEDGSSNLPKGTTFVRLLMYKAWSFTANTLNETFKSLCENLNKTSEGAQMLTTLQYPFEGAPPTVEQVQEALEEQENGTLTSANANILAKNALQMAYIPMNEQLRHGGNTVSWYRGPLPGYSITENFKVPVSGPDAANRYNPLTGLFDVSYGAAWQLGKLLAMQNEAFASALYIWKKSQTASAIAAAEAQIIKDKLGDVDVFSAVINRKFENINDVSEPPSLVTEWLGKLALLEGVPFNYLVPNEVMLPKESIRFFYLDLNWIDSMIDGAFSIGRSTSGEHNADTNIFDIVREHTFEAIKKFRKQPKSLDDYSNKSGKYTGFLLRSALVSGWPGLQTNGYSDTEGNEEIPKLWFKRLSPQVMLCIFDGDTKMVALHEPPEALHGGVEGTGASLTTTLRSVTGKHPGEQIIGASAPIPTRTGNQTIQINNAAASILKVLNSPPYNEGIKDFTAAQFALQMIKGVVKVEYLNKTGS